MVSRFRYIVATYRNIVSAVGFPFVVTGCHSSSNFQLRRLLSGQGAPATRISGREVPTTQDNNEGGPI